MKFEKIIDADSLKKGKDKINDLIENVNKTEIINGNVYSNADNIDGKFIDSTGVITNSATSIMARISVKANTTYSLWRKDGLYTTGSGMLRMVDVNFVILQKLDMSTKISGTYNGVNYITFTTTANTSFIEVNLKIGGFNSSAQGSLIILENTVINDALLSNQAIKTIFGYKIAGSDFANTIKSSNGNLYDYATQYVSGSYVNSSTGTLSKASTWGVAANIPVEASKTYTVAFKGSILTNISMSFMNSAGTVLSTLLLYKTDYPKGQLGEWTTIAIQSPVGATKANVTLVNGAGQDYSKGFSFYNGIPTSELDFVNYVYEINGKSVYTPSGIDTSQVVNNIKWVAIGDSLTERNSRTTKNYLDYIVESTGITGVIEGVGGTGYKKGDDIGKSFYQRALNIPNDCDVVTVFGSGNDNGSFTSGVQIGEWNDATTDTLAGCVNKTIANIYSVNPKAKIGIIAPTPWAGKEPWKTTEFMTLYVEMLRKICEYNSIAFLDLYHGSNLRPWDANFRTLAYSKDDGNGVHPDEFGHEIIASKVLEFIKTLTLIQ